MSYFLTSPRLGFRHWTHDDEIRAALIWQDAEVMRHMGGPYNEDGTRARLAAEIDRQERLGFQYWPIFPRETGGFAGCSGLRPTEEGEGVLELGVHIARSSWGARIGEEAARAVLGYAFATLGIRTIVAGHGPRNVNSKALILRLGFVYSHEEPWGARGILHPRYTLTLESWEAD